MGRYLSLLLFISISFANKETGSLPFYLEKQTMSENNLHINFSIINSDVIFKPFIPYYGMKKVNILIKRMGLEFGELFISNRDTIEIEFNPSNGFMIKKKHYGSFEETTYDYNIPKIISTGKDFRSNEETHKVKIDNYLMRLIYANM